MIMEIIENDERLGRIHDVGTGYIYNDFGGPNQTRDSMEFNKLHRTHCDHCNPRRSVNPMTVNTSGQKIHFESSSEAVGWLMANRPGNYTRCLFCNG